MADNDQYNDEYQFADLDAMSPDAGDENGIAQDEASSPAATRTGISGENNIKRKAIFVVIVFVCLLLGYKMIGSLFSGKKAVSTMDTPAAAGIMQPPAPQPIVQQPQTAAPVAVVPIDSKVTQELSALEVTQQSMRTDVASVNNQLVGISNNMNDMIAKMTALNGIIVNLSAKVDEQAREIEQLTIKRHEVRHIHTAVSHAPSYPKYYLQAVIPGRAWLIAANGATLTVREGTMVAGYGMVKLIDPNQGRVMTSSGQVIRFSQEDS